MDEPRELKVGDLVVVLYKFLDSRGECYDVARCYGKLISTDFDFANKFPYEVVFTLDGKKKTSCFQDADITFYDRPPGAKTIPIKEITYNEEDFRP